VGAARPSGGLIVGDDYGNAIYPGVKRAWDEYEARTASRSRASSPIPPAAQGTQLIYGVKP
jgi:hypothetical protein